ncbi:hypothetical protein Golob_028085 [Gossypium lobatum]|uniref:Uncharacterized protein n=1 Tax=Gossypium lobatum TaxID=34289 RepID=A0A7J8NE35_9ROSI|nr:hypothetical protein [Gossypium lobatum]
MMYLMSGSSVLQTSKLMGNIYCLKKRNLMSHSTVKNAHLFQLVLSIQIPIMIIRGINCVLL